MIQFITIGCPDKGTSVNSLATSTAAMFPNADDHLSNCVKNLSQYNQTKLKTKIDWMKVTWTKYKYVDFFKK